MMVERMKEERVHSPLLVVSRFLDEERARECDWSQRDANRTRNRVFERMRSIFFQVDSFFIGGHLYQSLPVMICAL